MKRKALMLGKECALLLERQEACEGDRISKMQLESSSEGFEQIGRCKSTRETVSERSIGRCYHMHVS